MRHIDGYVGLLLERCRGELTDQGRHYLDTIADSARQMGRLIDELLRFSRTGRAEMSQGAVDMNRTLREALDSLADDLTGRRIEWVIGDLPPASGDGALLRLVWANLLGNAIKYTRGKDQARIEVGALEGSEETTFFVRDDGVGFDMRYAHKLFGVFQRLHSETEFEGTGIGLATVRRIVSRHGGRTWAEGGGGPGRDVLFQPAQVGRRRTMSELRPILLADDNAKDVELTLAALADHNLANNVIVVRDGAEALEYLRCEGAYRLRRPGRPAVVILDIKMPRMDGLEVLKAIRADPALKATPVVMLTSSREEQDVVRSYELGVNAYVVKPVKFADFVVAVKHIGVLWAILNELPPEKGVADGPAE